MISSTSTGIYIFMMQRYSSSPTIATTEELLQQLYKKKRAVELLIQSLESYKQVPRLEISLELGTDSASRMRSVRVAS